MYYPGGEVLAKLTLDNVIKLLPEYEVRLNYNLSNGIKITVFNNYEDYRNSNINITNPQLYAGGYSTLNDNAGAIYFDGSRGNFQKQIRQALAEVLINEFIYGGNIRERIQTAALLTLPDWYYKGLVAYLSESWNIENDNFLKDFFQNKKQKYFTSLQREDEILAGHSIWRYLEEKNGKSTVSQIVFLTRIGRSVENAMMYYTGMNINMLLDDWRDFYLEKYKNDERVFKFPKGQENAPLKLAKKKHTQFKIHPDGKKVAIVTNNLGRYQVVIYDLESKGLEVLTKGGHQLINRNININYPLIAWEPSGKYLSVIKYKNEKPILENYVPGKGLIKSKELSDIEFVKDFCYQPDGLDIVFSVIRNGQSDLVLYNLSNGQTTSLTNDEFDDLSPRYSSDGHFVYYVSNRDPKDNSESDYSSIYKLDLKSGFSYFVTGKSDKGVNSTEPIPMENGILSFLSDQNGIVNNYIFNAKDSAVYQMTNYKRCIIHNDVAPKAGIVADLLYFNNRYRIYIGAISENFKEDAITDAELTTYRKILNQGSSNFIDFKPVIDSFKSNQAVIDSVPKVVKKVFISGYNNKEDLDLKVQGDKEKTIPFVQMSRSHFGVNYFLQQFDPSILNNYLFPANVNERIFTYPLLSPHFQTSISDDRNDHVVVAGFRIPVRIKASDYYINYTDRSGRWDKELSIFRRSRTIDNFIVPTKMVNAQAKYAFRYPFTERARIEFSLFGRNDKVIRQAIDSLELNRNVIDNLYGGNGIEYVFDNVRSNGLNLFEGLRFRIYNENYLKYKDNEFISNNGFDFRWYKKLHRQIYLASRFSGAFSFGTQRTAYYMGGVENWISNVDSNNTFNYNIPTLTGSEYAFQTITAPVRGFYRNSRGGDKYLLMNLEVRIPIFSYLIQKPISSEFFKSIMLVGFTDIGTAWKGNSPFGIDNPFNTRIVQSQQYKVTVVSQRDPLLYGFGFGVRTKILGHYIKLDQGWGLIENKFQKGLTSFSIGLDF